MYKLQWLCSFERNEKMILYNGMERTGGKVSSHGGIEANNEIVFQARFEQGTAQHESNITHYMVTVNTK